MKIKNLIFLTPFFILFACNNTGPKSGQITDSTKTEVHTEAKHIEPVKALSLNNGEKWQSDESTRIHAMKLSAIFNAFEKSSRTGISDYQALASEAQTELNALVKDCKMSGPDHDALHVWLEPILTLTAELKSINSMEEAEAKVATISGDINNFSTYFK